MAFVALVTASAVLGYVAMGRGELELYLVLIVPVLRASGWWGAASILLALAALVALFINLRSVMVLEGESGDKKVSAGGVVLIGPFPIVFGTDRRATVLALLAAVAVLATLLFFLLL